MVAKISAFRWLVRAGAALAAAFAGWILLGRARSAGGRHAVAERLSRDQYVIEAAERHSRENGVPLAASLGLVEGYAREISPAPDPRLYFKVGVPLAGLVVRFLYGGRLHCAGGENLPGGESGVIFVMNHRSNLDYVVLGHLIRDRKALSFASGEWARFWPLGPLVRAMGSFFVRRGSGDELYRRVLERFVQTGLERDFTPVVFVEGGLSRDGRLREPKIGFLDYALRRFDPAGDRDLLLVPVAINHDWVLEDGSLPSPGAPNPSGVGSVLSTFLFILRGLQLARSGPERLGHAAVEFGTPISARRWATSRNIDFRNLEQPARAGLVREFAADLMNTIGEIVPVLPVPVVAGLLIGASGEALAQGEIKARSHSLVLELERRGAWICFDEEDAVGAALRLLVRRGLVIQDRDNYRPSPEGGKLLRFYAASISHLYSVDG
ncbi:MAG: 1-acyl-sn-glycerol-3-phosphate acyltransferase [Rubrobacter sp.]|nr:1-acyl-sn-glycerol-3-phosphate acyltransferase [Rubrobacter sp.]